MPAFHRPPASYQQRRTLRHPRQSQTRRYRHGTSVSIEVAADAFAIGAPLAGAADAPGVSPAPKPITARMTKASSVLFMAGSMQCQGVGRHNATRSPTTIDWTEVQSLGFEQPPQNSAMSPINALRASQGVWSSLDLTRPFSRI